ncbi:hypothetical protein [Enterococcus sp. AZ183]|uniref:hypothetical protein n=1 Tax=Enterococcus sp. AZ183 TaxID=2774893 RepID=UPI003F223CA7
MRKGRLKRNKLAITLGIVSLIGSIACSIAPANFNNFTDIMSASLAFSSIATALFLASFSLIPAFTNSKFINALKDLGTDMKIMDRLIVSTLIFFLNSFFTFIELLFKSSETNTLSVIITGLWTSTGIMAFVSTFYIVLLLLKGFECYYESNKED